MRQVPRFPWHLMVFVDPGLLLSSLGHPSHCLPYSDSQELLAGRTGAEVFYLRLSWKCQVWEKSPQPSLLDSKATWGTRM